MPLDKGFYMDTIAEVEAQKPPQQLDALPARPPSPSNGHAKKGQARYVQKVLDGECDRVATAKGGSRNTTLNTAAFKLAGYVHTGHITEDVINQYLLEAALKADLPENEARKTILSGVTKGREKPREIPERQTRGPSPRGGSVHTPPSTIGSEPEPLRRPPPHSAPYPVEALGPILGPIAKEIARIVQVPLAIAGNSILAAASLSAQAHRDIEVYGRRSRLSIFALTVAESGDRKSMVDSIALRPHREYQNGQMDSMKPILADYERKRAAYEAAKKRVLGGREKKSRTEYEKALAMLGDPPEAPTSPVMLIDDCTVEAIRKHLLQGPTSCGLFSDDGARVLGGYSLKPENRLSAASVFTNLWDGKDTATVRVQDGLQVLRGKRLSTHLMVQPNVAPLLISSPELQGQGYLWRFLIVWPKSMMGHRPYKKASVLDTPEYAEYASRIGDLLRSAPSDRELSPLVLSLDADAEREYEAFYGECEAGLLGPLRVIAGLANRVPEHALRIAGVQHMVEGRESLEVDLECMRNAISLARWYLHESLRLHQGVVDDPDILLAEELLEWIRSRTCENGRLFTTRDVYQRGPNQIRTADKARQILCILAQHGWVTKTCERPETWALTVQT